MDRLNAQESQPHPDGPSRNLHHAVLPLLRRRQTTSVRQRRDLHRDRCGPRPGPATVMIDRAHGGRRCRRSSSARPMSAAATISTNSTRPAVSIRCSRAKASKLRTEDNRMTSGKASGFTAALIQMRSGLTPADNLDSALKLIERGGKERRRLRPDARDDQHPGAQARAVVRRDRREEDDTSLAAFRDARASTASTFMSARWRSRSHPTRPPTARS